MHHRRTGLHWAKALVTIICLSPILAYQHLIAPLVVNCCRFYPSCSVYAKEAILKHGLAKGSWLSAKRLIRCHPWGGKGHDPVPS